MSNPGLSRILPVIAVGVTLVLWASAFVGVRVAGVDYSPGALALGRQIVGSIALTVMLAIRIAHRGQFELPSGRTLLAVIAWGVAWFAGYNLALNSAEQVLDAGTTALLVNVAPVLVAILGGILLREGFPRRLLVGIAIAFAGVAVIAASTWTGAGNLIGVVLALAAAGLYAGGTIAQKRILMRVDALTMTWIGSIAGMLACMPFGRVLIAESATATSSATAMVIYLGVFPTAIAFTTWGYALARMSAGRLVATTYLVPPLVIVASWVMLGEVPSPLTILGGLAALVGVAIATLPTRTRRDPQVAELPRAAAAGQRSERSGEPEVELARGRLG